MSIPHIAFHASHEQFNPPELLRYVKLARHAGFDAIHSSEHFQPWNQQQGESGHAFTWLGALTQICDLPFGLVCAPGYRHHPAVVAQAIATLAQLANERIWIALGSGEAVNERITGQHWPTKARRNQRLVECFHIIRRLLDGETVSHNGEVTVEEARLYTLPPKRPLLLGAALTAETAYWMGDWAEGLLTIGQPPEKLAEIIEQFRRGGGLHKPVYVKVQLSYARDESLAYEGAYHQWRTNVFDSSVLADLWKPEQFEAAAKFVRPEDLHQAVYIASDVRRYVLWLKKYLELGVDCLILHNVNREQQPFIEDFGKQVIPGLKAG